MDDLTKPMLCDEQDAKKADMPIKKLVIVSLLCLFFMIIEIVGGYLANSLAILSDAAHLLSDISGFTISIFALYMSKRPSSQIMSFGYHRAETIGALISISIVWGLVLWLVYEALTRIIYPEQLDPLVMMATAAIGLLVNITMASTLHSGHGHHHGHDHGQDHEHDHGHSHTHDHGHSISNNSHKPKVKPELQKSNENSITNENFKSISESNTDFIIPQGSYPLEDSLPAHHKNYSEGFHNVIKDEFDRTARTSGEIGVVPEFNQMSRVTNKNESNRFVIEVDSIDFPNSSEADSDLSEICSHVHEAEEENINVHAALVHIIGDLIQSIGVLIASIILYFFPDWVCIDPICTLVFSVIVMFTTIPVAKECFLILSESIPKHFDVKQLEKDFLHVSEI